MYCIYQFYSSYRESTAKLPQQIGTCPAELTKDGALRVRHPSSSSPTSQSCPANASNAHTHLSSVHGLSCCSVCQQFLPNHSLITSASAPFTSQCV